jgi:DnaK suppressor protein
MTKDERELTRLKLRRQVEELAGSMQDREVIAIERSTDVTDELERAGARDIALTNLSRRFKEIRLVESALDRIADGTYGTCLRCDEEISKRRLDAVPSAGFCIKCQEKEEQGHSDTDLNFEAEGLEMRQETREYPSKSYRL